MLKFYTQCLQIINYANVICFHLVLTTVERVCTNFGNRTKSLFSKYEENNDIMLSHRIYRGIVSNAWFELVRIVLVTILGPIWRTMKHSWSKI